MDRAARPGSWEADLVERLVRGTVGWDDESLMTYRSTPIQIVVNPDEEFTDLGIEGMYGASLEHIVDAVTGGRWTSPAPAINLTEEEAEQIDAADDLVEALRQRDTIHYEERFTAAVQAELQRLRASNPDRIPDHLGLPSSSLATAPRSPN